MNYRVTVVENRLKNFQLQLQLLTFENFQLQLQQNRAINYNFVNYNYKFSKPDPQEVFFDLVQELATFWCMNRFCVFLPSIRFLKVVNFFQWHCSS